VRLSVSGSQIGTTEWAAMTIRTLINTLRELERIRDTESPPDRESHRSAPAGTTRELDRRHSDGIDVRLLWNQTDDLVVVAVTDAKSGDAFAIPVAPDKALTAFHHPYAYATSMGGAHQTLAV